MKKNKYYVLIIFIFLVISYLMVNYSFAENSQYYIQQGDYFKNKSDFQSAKDSYQKAIDLDSSSWIAYTGEGNFEKAKSLCLKALNYNSKNYMAWNILGGCYHELGEDPKKTEDTFRRSWDIKKNKSALQGLIGVIGDYEGAQRYSEAERLLAYLLSLNLPENNRRNLEKWLEDIRKIN